MAIEDLDEMVLKSIQTEEERIIEQESSFLLYRERISQPGAYQQVSLVDLNMMSGSSETIRTALGGYFKNVPKAAATVAHLDRTWTSEELRLTTPPAFVTFDARVNRNINPYVHSVTSYANEKINDHLRMLEGETGAASLESGATYDEFSPDPLDVSLQRQTGLAVRYQDTILPSNKFVVHIEGDPYAYGEVDTVLTDISKGNKFWKTLWTGGEYAEANYTALYQNAVYDDHYIHFPMHYRKAQLNALFPKEDSASSYIQEQGDVDTYLETTFEYNKHLKTYQSFINDLPDVKLIPNYYLMHSVKRFYDPMLTGPSDEPTGDGAESERATAGYRVNTNVIDYYTFSNLVTPETFASFFDDLGSPVYPEGFELDDGTYYESHDQLPFEGYLNVLFPKFYDEIKQENRDYMISAQRNLFFNHDARRYTKGAPLDTDPGSDDYLASVSNQRRTLPFYTTIAFDPLFTVFDSGAGKQVRKSIEKYNQSTMILRALKECFLSQSGVKSTITPTMKEFVVNQSMIERAGRSLQGAGAASIESISSRSTDDDYAPSDPTGAAERAAQALLTHGGSDLASDFTQEAYESGHELPFINKTISNVASFRTVDFIEMMIHNIMNYKNDNHDFSCVSGDSIESLAAYDKKGVYRAYNSKNALNAMNEIVSKFPADDGTSANRWNSSYELFNSATAASSPTGMVSDHLQKFYPCRSKEYEIIAYRVEKTGGPGTGDSSTREVLQNFWFWNSAGSLDGDETEEWPFRFIDSQVRYGEEYTYKVYAYYLVSGVKYETSNFQLSRIIGPVYDRDFNPSPEGGEKIYDYDEERIKAYCIEMYNPDTGDTVDDLLELAAYGPAARAYETGTTAYGSDDVAPIDPDYASLLETLQISSYASDGQRIAVSRASTYESGESAYNIAPPYMANFVVTTQPSFKVIEVPIERKAFKISDNPPNVVNAVPGYARDNSNKIIFELQYQVFNPTTYPVSITTQDIVDKVSYVTGKDVTFFNHVQHSSISRLSAVEVYRLSKLPAYFSDFEGALHDKVDFKIKDSNAHYTTCVYSDIIKSNTKYYYLFRAINDNSVTGYIDNVLQVELVNDGGYKYPIFKTLYDTDIEEMREENSPGKAAKEVKNLIELIPSYSHTVIDDSSATYANPITTEYQNIKIGQTGSDSIWGKTFKLRLTSKKTGKKIDLNITYNEPTGNLTED